MNVGIPGLSGRELWMSIWMLILCVAGSVGNYIFHKLTGKGWGTATAPGFIRALVLGGIAGLILMVVTQGGAGIGHFDIILIALPVGAAAELTVGKYLGWQEAAKQAAFNAKNEDDPDWLKAKAEEFETLLGEINDKLAKAEAEPETKDEKEVTEEKDDEDEG